MDAWFQGVFGDLAAVKTQIGFGQGTRDPNGLTDYERLAIRAYTSSRKLYRDINAALRTGQSLTSQAGNLVGLVDSALSKIRPIQREVYRGHQENDLPGDIQQRYALGNLLIWQSFTSATIDADGAFSGNILFFINSLSACPIMMYSDYFGEYEVLFPRGCQFISRGTTYQTDPSTGLSRHIVVLNEI